jgi:hypothetical protein
MTTVAVAVERTRQDHLLAGHREQRNRLTSSIDTDDTSLSFDFDLGAIATNARISLGYEDMGVWEASAGAKTAEVQRGDFGTTAVAHAAGATVIVNSIFTPSRVFSAIKDELAALVSAGLFRMRTVDLTYDPSVMGYDLTGVSDLTSIYEVRAQTSGPEQDWPILDSWTVARDMPTTSFASGTALILRDQGEAGRTIRVRYKAPFAAIVDGDTDLQAVCGLPTTADDLLQVGAAIRLVAPREVKRNFTESQGDTRRSEEAPTGSQLQSVRGLLAVYERRVMEEQKALLRLYPPRRRTTTTV